MPEPIHCAECRAPLPAYWPKGLRTRCALDGVLELTEPDTRINSSNEPSSSSGNQPSPAGPASTALGGRFGACATFQWLGLEAVSNQTQEFRALKSRRAVDYRNETGKPTQHYLRIDAVDGSTTNNTCAVFGPFNVPTGAVHCVILQDWPRVKQVRSELDLNADGTPDEVTMVTGAEIDSDGDGCPTPGKRFISSIPRRTIATRMRTRTAYRIWANISAIPIRGIRVPPCA